MTSDVLYDGNTINVKNTGMGRRVRGIHSNKKQDGAIALLGKGPMHIDNLPTFSRYQSKELISGSDCETLTKVELPVARLILVLCLPRMF